MSERDSEREREREKGRERERGREREPIVILLWAREKKRERANPSSVVCGHDTTEKHDTTENERVMERE